ncbi:MAG: dihydroxy-acid dehydratase, partial [Granulosicoccus sp.]
LGTASTMACMVEALCMGMPGNASIPAADSRRRTLAHMAGRRIVDMVHEDLVPSKILTPDAFQNAVRANGAIGGSTNAVIHLLALAGRLGVEHTLDDWEAWGREEPCLVNLMPSGEYLMEDFDYAGGLPSVLRKLGESGFLNKDALTVNGKTQWENVSAAQTYGDEVIYPIEKPFKPAGGICILRGNLAPDGAVLKPSAATPALMQHTGRAVVFENIEDYKQRIDTDDLDVDASCILVLKNCGPRGYPGMAEVGNMALPAKVLKTGVTDMVRISDARMSGTAYGTVVLHVCPEAAVGGPLALVHEGDMITLDVAAGSLSLDVDEATLQARRERWQPTHPQASRGYVKMYQQTVMQASEGADLDFLRGGSGAPVPRDSH